MKVQIYKFSVYLPLLVAIFGFITAEEVYSQLDYGSNRATLSHISQINTLYTQSGIKYGHVTTDVQGRVELIGSYNDERQVDLAFSLAQSVVGVNLVSPVTPENIQVKEWGKCLELILSRQVRGRCGAQTIPARTIDPSAPGPVANKYALVVGVGTYQNGINPLQYASTDAVNFYNYLVSPTGGRFDRQDVILLRDQQATKAAIVNALNEIRAEAKEDDLVIVYLSSHGTPPDKFGGVYVATYDSQVKPRESIWNTSISADILRDFIQGVRAKRLVMVMDACYSNGAYTQVSGFLPSGSKSLTNEEDEGYGRSNKYMSQRLLGAKDIIIDENVQSSSTSGNSEGWGKVLVSASGAGERSWESDTLHSSIFTYYFLQGLQLNNGNISEAFDHSKPRVGQRVRQEKGSYIIQTPQITPSRSGWNMSVAVPER